MKSTIVVLSLLVVAGFAFAAQDESGYVHEKVSGKLVRTGLLKQCVRTGTWTPEKAIPECDPVLAQKNHPTGIEGPRSAPVVTSAPAAETAPLKSQDEIVGVPLKLDTAAPRVSITFIYVFFDFDKSKLDKEATTKLGTIKLSGHDYLTIRAYTDRIGTTAYNNKLAGRRAASVSKYFSGHGVKVDSSTGVGKSLTAVCGKMTTKQLKACLRADRFAVIELQSSYK